MLWTNTLIPTLRTAPKDVEATSHQLMLRAGYIRQLSSGVYDYLPLGCRVIKKVESLIREEMFRAGADEVLLPAIHPAEIWKRTGRYEALGEDKFAFKNRSGQEYVLGPTHEEIITELVAASTKSYKDFPLTLFQIQTKFRDELRPRFGVIRSKEFIMKDAYSFDCDEAGLEKSFRKMAEAYRRIFTRSGLSYEVVEADPGLMGGKVSQEFMVRSPYGEDTIAHCKKCGYTVSRDIARRSFEAAEPKHGDKPYEAFDTPDLKSIEELCRRFKLKPEELVKTIIYIADGKPVAACVAGGHEVNEGKLRQLLGAEAIRLANAEEIEELTKAPLGFSGPVGLKGVTIVLDADILRMKNFYTGANEKDKHFRNVSVARDFNYDLVGDIRFVAAGDSCPSCKGRLELVTTMEIGHIFKLGTRYTKALNASFLDDKGMERDVIMGCYGIGVNRIIAAAIEEHHDDKGIIWPLSIAPYDVVIVTLNEQDAETRKVANDLYAKLGTLGIDVLYDNRDERAGVKFNDADLIGIPLQVVISERNLKERKLELVRRKGKEASFADIAQAPQIIQDKVKVSPQP
ncbi:MAG: proline--tRNA ligase [Candidatus Omnitrophica bacterium]|nr:proline--tRNA ligase [Candidatus Omnitrophota bacterium]